jgi:erythromycin esterase
MSSRTPSAAAQSNPFTVSPFDLHDSATSAVLTELTADKAVIGVGEAAHFVSEFNLLRAEAVERLVAGHGVTHLALEAGIDESPTIESWLRHETQDSLAHLVGPLTHMIYGTFLDELRNRLGTDHQVAVIGVDLPNSLTIEPSLAPLAEVLATIDPDAADLVVRGARQLSSSFSDCVDGTGPEPSGRTHRAPDPTGRSH